MTVEFQRYPFHPFQHGTGRILYGGMRLCIFSKIIYAPHEEKLYLTYIPPKAFFLGAKMVFMS